MERGLILLRGWTSGGYDENHPDIWPPEPELGSIDELRHLLEVGEGLVIALHDNYRHMYPQSPSFPQGIIQRRDGKLMRGGLGSGGQSYIVNMRSAVGYLRRNWEQLKTLKPRAMFPGMVAATPFFESYERGNELTREQDYDSKLDLFRFYKAQGVLLGSEEGADFNIRYVDWFENRHVHVPGESIPVWGLVFHDAVISCRTPLGSWLPDMLWGYAKLWRLGAPSDWEAQRSAFARSVEVDRWHACIGFDELLTHQYLAPGVERTQFTNGSITVNFNAEPVTVAGKSIPANAFRTETH